VWEIIRTVSETKGRGENRLRAVAATCDLSLAQVRLAVDFYATFPDDIDRQLESHARAAEQIHQQIRRREKLLST
jgi:hypothetical protein